MRPALAIITLAAATSMFGACSRLKGGDERQPTAAAPVAVGTAATAETAAPFHVPTKEEYYQMLRAGYEPPRHTVSGNGYSSGSAGTTRPRLSEKEGEGLKWKFGEGRKAAAGGRGEAPKAPSWVQHDDEGTYPPRDFKGGD